jgi:hypothetical protein
MMDSTIVKRLVWSGMLAGLGALFAILSNRTATALWRRIFDEEPPE